MALGLLTGLSFLTNLVGKGIEGYQNAQVDKVAEEDYSNRRGRLLTDMYANPLDNVTNKAILSQMNRRLNKSEESIQNQAAAGGATFENVLAAKQASNEAMADVHSGIMQWETARQDSLRSQLLNLDSQRTAQQMAAKQAAGQNWAGLLGNVGDSLTTLGGTLLDNNMKLKDLIKWS